MISEFIRMNNDELADKGLIDYIRSLKNKVAMRTEGYDSANPMDVLLYNMKKSKEIKFLVLYHKNQQTNLIRKKKK